MSKFHEMSIGEYIGFLKVISKLTFIDFDPNQYDGLWFKKLPAADIIQVNKPTNVKGKTSHIAITGVSKKMFNPAFLDWDLYDIKVVPKKILKSTDSVTLMQSHFALRVATDKIGKHQLSLSKKNLDDTLFYGLREEIYTGDFLLILKVKNKTEYVVVAFDAEIDEDEFKKNKSYISSDDHLSLHADSIDSVLLRKLKKGLRVETNELKQMVLDEFETSDLNQFNQLFDNTIEKLKLDSRIEEMTDSSKSYFIYVDKNFIEYLNESSDNAILSESSTNESSVQVVRHITKKAHSKQIQNRYPTDQKVRNIALQNSNFQCEYAYLKNLKHDTFTSRKNNLKYVEGHHLVRMCDQENQIFERKEGLINLDQVENIIPLCPTCHAKIHLGQDEDIEEMLTVLYEHRKIKLSEIGINITLPQLINLYKF